MSNKFIKDEIKLRMKYAGQLSKVLGGHCSKYSCPALDKHWDCFVFILPFYWIIIKLHSVAKVYAVLPFYDVKCLCSGGQEWGREESHSH